MNAGLAGFPLRGNNSEGGAQMFSRPSDNDGGDILSPLVSSPTFGAALGDGGPMFCGDSEYQGPERSQVSIASCGIAGASGSCAIPGEHQEAER